jgi:TPR repeat protein
MKGLGVNKNVSEAINLFHQAAALGHGNSQLILALMYKYGDEVPLDYIKAYKYADLASGTAINDSDRATAMGLRDDIYLLMSDKEKNFI